MKFKLMVLALSFSIVSFAQTTDSSKPEATKSQGPAVAQSARKAECSCCKAIADGKDAKPCCHHDATAGKEATGCCGGKEGMSCMKGEKAQSAEAVPASCCEGADQKGCCPKSEKTSEATTMACCGPGGHCGMQQHEHAELNK